MRKFRIADGGLRIGIAVAIGGCIAQPQNPSATQPATAVDAQLAQPAYWLDQPASASVNSEDFQQLWGATERVARDHGFKLDRVDWRIGLLTTEPRISPQFFEIWRSDVGTLDGWTQSSLATVRRTARFEFSRGADGAVSVTPKVLVERYAQAERRITSVVQYRSAVSPASAQRGSRERDAGIDLPGRYWYAVGRDEPLEQRLAEKIRQQMGAASPS